jgi:1,4-alpha-glucan branching enzyme
MRKQPGRNGSCKVTFELPAEVGANAVHVCGDFNDWSTTATPLKRRKDGTFAATLTLEAGRRYRLPLPARRWRVGERLGGRRLRPQRIRR